MATVRTVVGGLLIGSAVVVAPPAAVTGGSAAYGQKAPASGDPLATKGLVKSGTTYVLPAEQEILKSMAGLRALRGKIDAETKQRQQIERQVNAAKGAIARS